MDASQANDVEVVSSRRLISRLAFLTIGGSILILAIFREEHGPLTGENILTLTVICPHGNLIYNGESLIF